MLERVDGFDAQLRDQILAPLSDDAIEAIRKPLPIGWLEMDLHMSFCDRLFVVLGEPGYRALWADVTMDFCNRPLLRGLIGMGQRLYASTPRAAVRLIPRMYAAGSSGLGELTIQVESDELFFVRLDGFPPGRWDFDNYVSGLRGALQGVSDHTFKERDTGVELDRVLPDEGSATFRYTLREPS